MKADWKTIDTIPRNQTVFVYDKVEGIYPARLGLIRLNGDHYISTPTHWASLPDSPQEEEEGEGVDERFTRIE